MFKRKDNDIFGTSGVGFAPKIENNSFIDPNLAFKKRSDENYEKYSSKIQNTPHVITGKLHDHSKVNENANFEEDYHKNRKQKDLQSSIFYPPIDKSQIVKNNIQNNSLNINKSVKDQANYGRKQTLNRQINQLPYNYSTKGNSSRLFDMDQRMKDYKIQTNSVDPLIPNKMQWDQHDSIKYAHINANISEKNSGHKNQIKSLENLAESNISQSQSTYFQKNEPQKEQSNKLQCNGKGKKIQGLNKIKSQKQLVKGSNKQQAKQKKEPVEIKILKGWSEKYMEGLSKQCKINGTIIQKFEIDDQQKATVILKRSQRWQNVTDWLRKEGKMKIRVVNP